MPVLLENKQPRMVTYEIPVPNGGGQRTKVGAFHRERGSKSGDGRLVVQHRIVPTSITLAAKGTEGSMSEPLPDRIVDVPAIAEAIRKRELVKTDMKEQPPAAAPIDDAPDGAKQEE